MEFIDLPNIEVIKNNERDLEIPAIINIVKKYGDNIESLLDVGAHWSWNSYASQVKDLVPNAIYRGIDLNPDENTSQILDKYIVGNVLDLPENPKYDLVFSISSIEHSGIIAVYPPKNDWLEERKMVLKKINDLSKKYIFITVPYGMPCYIPEGYANFTDRHISWFLDLTKNYKYKMDFFYRENINSPYQKISKEEADQVPYIEEQGNRCNCFLFIDKT